MWVGKYIFKRNHSFGALLLAGMYGKKLPLIIFEWFGAGDIWGTNIPVLHRLNPQLDSSLKWNETYSVVYCQYLIPGSHLLWNLFKDAFWDPNPFLWQQLRSAWDQSLPSRFQLSALRGKEMTHMRSAWMLWLHWADFELDSLVWHLQYKWNKAYTNQPEDPTMRDSLKTIDGISSQAPSISTPVPPDLPKLGPILWAHSDAIFLFCLFVCFSLQNKNQEGII